MAKYLVITLMLIIALTVTGCDSTMKNEKLDYTANEVFELLENKKFFEQDNYCFSRTDQINYKADETDSSDIDEITELTYTITKQTDNQGQVSYIYYYDKDSDGVAYYKDGFEYLEIDGEKIKRKLSEEDFFYYIAIYRTNDADPLGKISQEDIISTKVSKKGKTKIVTANISANFITKWLGGTLDNDAQIEITLKIFILKDEKIADIQFYMHTDKSVFRKEFEGLYTVTFKGPSAFELPDLSEYESDE